MVLRVLLTIFGVCMLLTGVCVVGAILVGRNLRYSFFYDWERGTAQLLQTEQRLLQQAQQWLHNNSVNVDHVSRDTRGGHIAGQGNASAPLCVVMLSAPRAVPYVTAAVHHLLQPLSAQDRATIAFTLVHREAQAPAASPQASLSPPGPALAQVPPQGAQDAHLDATLQRLADRVETRTAVQGTQSYDVERMDYATALRQCVVPPRGGADEGVDGRRGCDWCLVLQDDVIASRTWLRTLLHVLHTGVPQWVQRNGDARARGGDAPSPPAYVKLFYTEFWSGWSVEDVPLLLAYAALVLLGTAWLASYAWLRHTKGRHTSLGEHVFVVGVIVYAVAMICIGVPLSIGKQHLWPPFARNRLQVSPPASACAIAYPRQHVESLAGFLERGKAGAIVDIEIEAWQGEFHSGSPGLMWWPPLFQHIGLRSSLEAKPNANVKRMKQALAWDENG